MDDAVLKIMEVTGTEAASLHVLSEEGSQFAQASARGFSETPMAAMLGEPWSDTLRDLLRTIREPLFAVDLQHASGLPQRLLATAGFRSAAFLPLQTSEKALGLMTLASREAGWLNPRQEELFTAMQREYLTLVKTSADALLTIINVPPSPASPCANQRLMPVSPGRPSICPQR